MGSLAGVQYVGRPLIIIAKMREFQFVAISANNWTTFKHNNFKNFIMKKQNRLLYLLFMSNNFVKLSLDFYLTKISERGLVSLKFSYIYPPSWGKFQ